MFYIINSKTERDVWAKRKKRFKTLFPVINKERILYSDSIYLTRLFSVTKWHLVHFECLLECHFYQWPTVCCATDQAHGNSVWKPLHCGLLALTLMNEISKTWTTVFPTWTNFQRSGSSPLRVLNSSGAEYLSDPWPAVWRKPAAISSKVQPLVSGTLK